MKVTFTAKLEMRHCDVEALDDGTGRKGDWTEICYALGKCIEDELRGCHLLTSTVIAPEVTVDWEK